MNTIYWSIDHIFPEINWEVINYTNYPRIRFYFDDKKKELFNIQNLTTNIINNIFDWNNIYVAITFFSQNAKLDNKIMRWIEERWLMNILNTLESRIINVEEEVSWYYYFTQIQVSEIEKINKAIIEMDFDIDPSLGLKCYYFCPEKHLIINLYDDRGMDIISDNINILEEIQNKWKKEVTIKIEHK